MTPHSGKDGEEEEDYMSMIISEPPQRETFAQKKLRQQREAESRGRIPSKAERAAQEAARRDEALATSTLDPTNKGYQMMIKLGFKPGEGLGRQQQQSRRKGGQDLGAITPGNAGESQDGSSSSSSRNGIGAGTTQKNEKENDDEEKSEETSRDDQPRSRIEPLNLVIKEDRGGIGLDSERKRKFLQAAGGDHGTAKRAKAKADDGEYRDRVRMERELKRIEAQVYAAQRVAEEMDSGAEKQESTPSGERKKNAPPFKVNVLYRGIVRDREAKEKDMLARRALESSLPTSSSSHSFFPTPRRLPGYIDTDRDGDDDNQQALPLLDRIQQHRRKYDDGDDSHIFLSNVEQELDDDDDGGGGDAELDAFNALDPRENLSRLVMYLREKHRYCFWCKARYETGEMEGCPGVTEEDHD